jgi:hypothetical protein
MATVPSRIGPLFFENLDGKGDEAPTGRAKGSREPVETRQNTVKHAKKA